MARINERVGYLPEKIRVWVSELWAEHENLEAIGDLKDE